MEHVIWHKLGRITKKLVPLPALDGGEVLLLIQRSPDLDLIRLPRMLRHRVHIIIPASAGRTPFPRGQPNLELDFQ